MTQPSRSLFLLMSICGFEICWDKNAPNVSYAFLALVILIFLKFSSCMSTCWVLLDQNRCSTLSNFELGFIVYIWSKRGNERELLRGTSKRGPSSLNKFLLFLAYVLRFGVVVILGIHWTISTNTRPNNIGIFFHFLFFCSFDLWHDFTIDNVNPREFLPSL